jgi:formamidopyrimidine-DNA glycosylase
VPERPDLEYVIPILDQELAGLTITHLRVKKPVVLRITVPGAPQELLVGQTFRGVRRRAHFVLFELDGPCAIELAVSPMLAGCFALASSRSRPPGDLALAFGLSDGRELRYRDDVQMGKVYIIERGACTQVPGLATIGIDVLDARVFTRDALRALARQRRDQVKVFLMDKTALDAMGNAYADEVLWAARLHPKRMARTLTDEEVDRLHDAIVDVLAAARAHIAGRQPALDEKLRDFLKVRGRRGEPCARCGTKIPECQPDSRRTSIVDWRQVTRGKGKM